jgi:hypothetical protein
MPADDELYPGDIGEGAEAGDGALPCRVLTKDELRRMVDCVTVFVKEVEVSPGDYVSLYTVSGMLDGRLVKDSLYTGHLEERCVPPMPAIRELTEEEWLKEYAPPGARRGSGR